MILKKIVIKGAIVLVLIGCIIAAGCTSTQLNTNDPIIGTWGTSFTENDVGIDCATFFADGIGTEDMLYPTGDIDVYDFTWIKTGDKTYQLTYSDGSIWETTIIDDDSPLVWKPITNKDHIIGTWPGIYVENGEKISDSTTFNPDFTGVSIGTFVDSPAKEKLNQKFTWAKNGPNSYVLHYDYGAKWFATYNDDTKSVSFKREDYTNDPIIGTYTDADTEFNVEGTTTYTFAPNGNGNEIQTSEKGIKLGEYGFFWNKEDINKYSLTYPSTTIWEFWTLKYDSQKKALDDWNLEQYTWVDNYRNNGKHLLDLHYFNGKTGTATEFDGEGNLNVYQTTWEILGPHKFKVTYEDGDVWYATYMPLTNTYEWVDAKE